jgi:LPS export ABC transporter protein LptC
MITLMKKVPVAMWPIIGIFSLFIIVAFFLFKVQHLDMVSSKTPNLTPGESLKISDIKYSQDYKGGGGKWELRAKEGHFFNNDQFMALKDVLLTLDSFNKTSYTIKGNEGNYFRKNGKIILKGDVLGRSAAGYHIETNFLTYRQGDNEVETDEPVKIIGPFFQVKGDGLYIDLGRKKFVVKKNVCTIFNGEVFFVR